MLLEMFRDEHMSVLARYERRSYELSVLPSKHLGLGLDALDPLFGFLLRSGLIELTP